MSEFLDKFAEDLIQWGLASFWTIRGCKTHEITKLEQHFEIRLPQIYKEFLAKMGHRAGIFSQGTDMFYESLFTNREGFQELLEEDKFSFVLEPKLFVFSSHQGYIYHFFNVEENVIDPPIYGYMEGELKIKKVNDSFSAFLIKSLAEQKQIKFGG